MFSKFQQIQTLSKIGYKIFGEYINSKNTTPQKD